jgi:hypothetical protein
LAADLFISLAAFGADLGCFIESAAGGEDGGRTEYDGPVRDTWWRAEEAHMTMVKRCSILLALGILLGCWLAASPSWAQSSDQVLPEEWSKVRRALEKYQDIVVAVRDGYLSSILCVQDEAGAGMGIHFRNPRVTGTDPDPMRPHLLLYEPVGDKLQLVGAEWFIPLATGVKERPNLFGQPFDGPMEGHPPTQPADLHHYDLHVWLFKANPAGLFKPFNPSVKCPNGGYTHVAEPTKIVSHPKP